jgi:putative NIF3 family GTP cyclohydrolase 1 type 2
MIPYRTDYSRRKFLAATLGVAGLSTLPNIVVGGNLSSADKPTVDEIMKAVTYNVSVGSNTVDTLKSGKGSQVVTGIVTTMFATVDVIRKAIDEKANFIIAHEPTFYNHLDDTEWLAGHEVFRLKKQLLDQNGIAVWRLHDYIHAFRPDGVLTGVLDALDWKRYYDPGNPLLLQMPQMKLGDIFVHLKAKLGIEKLRFVGDPGQVCQRISLLPGAWGGRMQISTIHAQNPDVVICGEVAEWETCEYIRDAQALGRKQSLIVLGHSPSEEPGMKWLKDWLQPKYPTMKIVHVPSKSPFAWA